MPEAVQGLQGPRGLDDEVALGFSVAFTGAPEVGSYPFSRYPRTTTNTGVSVPEARVAWEQELTQPGVVFGSLETGMKIDKDSVSGHFAHPLNTGSMKFPDFYQCGGG